MTTYVVILSFGSVETWQRSRQVRQLVLWIQTFGTVDTDNCCGKASLANSKELSIRTARARWDVKSDTGRERERERYI